MDYSFIFDKCGDRKSRLGVIGATKGFGYTLLAQLTHIDRIDLRFASSRHPEECVEVLKELGYPEEKLVICESESDVRAAKEDAVIISANNDIAFSCGLTSIIECTGNTRIGCSIAKRALTSGLNVYMVSKETDSFAGPMLSRIAHENGTVYALVNGDQPRNLVDLISWARTLGLEIVCAGKSSEYDLLWDGDTKLFSYTDEHTHTEFVMPEMEQCWHYSDIETLKKRGELLKDYVAPISANFCEMNLVSNVMGMLPAKSLIECPILKPSELADVLVPVEDGGILTNTGVLQVFFDLRASDEASFGGGEFVVVKCANRKVWELLRAKGHVVSRSGKYACIYAPYHIMGVESPMSILLGDLLGIGGHADTRQVSVLSGVANCDLKAGTEFYVHGHHHDINGLDARLLAREPGMVIAPFYLLNGKKLVKDVKKGSPVMLDDVDLSNSIEYELYTQGLSL